MQAVNLIQNIFKSWFILLQFCARSPINTPACISLWVYIAMACGVAGVLLFTWAILKVLRYYTAPKAGEEFAGRTAIAAGEETMTKHRWAGEDQRFETDSNMEKRIKAILAAQRLEERWEKQNDNLFRE